jgi:hypothetical protein
VDARSRRQGDGCVSLVAAAAPLPGRHDDVARVLVEALDRLAAGVVGASDVAAVREVLDRDLCAPDLLATWLPAVAADLLAGCPVTTPDQERRLLAEVTVEQVRGVAAQVRDAAVLVLPSACAPPRAGFPLVPRCLAEPVTGTRYPARPGDRSPDAIVVGPDGVSLSVGGRTETVRFAGCVALLVWPGGVRELVGFDATALHLDTTQLPDPVGVRELIDAAVPASVVVAMPGAAAGPVGDRGGAPRAARSLPVRMRVRPGLVVALAMLVVPLVLFALVHTVIRGAVPEGVEGPMIVVGAWAVVVAVRWWRARRGAGRHASGGAGSGQLQEIPER